MSKRVYTNVVFVGPASTFSRLVSGMKKTLNEKNMPKFEAPDGTIYQVIAVDVDFLGDNTFYWTRSFVKRDYKFPSIEDDAFLGIQEEVNE